MQEEGTQAMIETLDEKIARWKARGPKPKKPPTNKFGRILSAHDPVKFGKIIARGRQNKVDKAQECLENKPGTLT
jgi:hypothetical protein